MESVGAVAGRNAISEVSQHLAREDKLKETEARLAAKEMELNGKLAKVRACDDLEEVLGNIGKVR